ncbi:MAG: hypothetical protein HN337_04635 [Deltaproteobacteria bacterium]|nr:hypothetical protein [Deltaproteobacteria bacterium]
MKRLVNTVRALMVFMVMVGMVGCGSSSGTTASGTDGSTPSEIMNSDTMFYDAVQQVAPSFSKAASASVSLSTSKAVVEGWESGNPVYEIFYLLQDFDPDTDQGVIDTSNLYKTMWEGRGMMANAISGCEPIEEQIIYSPFDYGKEVVAYNCAVNDEPESGYDRGSAVKMLDSDGTIIEMTDESIRESDVAEKHGLFGFVWVDSGESAHQEYGVIQGGYNEIIDELEMDIAVWVDYDGDRDYCYRNELVGSIESHEFTFRSVKGSLAEDTTMLSIVGQGVSRGEGNHFLLKASTESIEGKYYCISATDGEDELMLMDAEGSDTVDEDCTEFADAVDALEPMTRDDLLCDESQLSGGSVLLDFVE